MDHNSNILLIDRAQKDAKELTECADQYFVLSEIFGLMKKENRKRMLLPSLILLSVIVLCVFASLQPSITVRYICLLAQIIIIFLTMRIFYSRISSDIDLEIAFKKTIQSYRNNLQDIYNRVKQNDNLPIEYLYPVAIEHIRGFITNGEADNIESAIMKYDKEVNQLLASNLTTEDPFYEAVTWQLEIRVGAIQEVVSKRKRW